MKNYTFILLLIVMIISLFPHASSSNSVQFTLQTKISKINVEINKQETYELYNRTSFTIEFSVVIWNPNKFEVSITYRNANTPDISLLFNNQSNDIPYDQSNIRLPAITKKTYQPGKQTIQKSIRFTSDQNISTLFDGNYTFYYSPLNDIEGSLNSRSYFEIVPASLIVRNSSYEYIYYQFGEGFIVTNNFTTTKTSNKLVTSIMFTHSLIILIIGSIFKYRYKTRR